MMKKRTLKRRILALATCTLVLIGAIMLPIGAESSTEKTNTIPPAYTSPVEWLNYPGANLIPYPYNTADEETQNGITFSTEADGSIIINGKAEENIWFSIGTAQLSVGEQYTICCYGSNNKLYSNIKYGENKNAYDTGTGSSFIAEISNCNIGLIIYAGINFTDYKICLQLNKGDVAYPYQPYLPYYLQQAFDNGYLNGHTQGKQDGTNEGYENGYTEGYSEGYVDGETIGIYDGYENGYKNGYNEAVEKLNNMPKNIFDTAKFTAILIGDNPTTGVSYEQTFQFTPNKIESGISFEKLYDLIDTWLEDKFEDNVTGWNYVDGVYIQMNWSEDKVFEYQALPVYIYGDFDVSSGTITTTTGESYVIDASQGNNSGNTRKFTVLTETTKPILVNTITIQVGRPMDLLTAFTLYAPDESYNNGYTNGYKTGFDEAEGVGTTVSYNKGYKEGFINGKEEGLTISETGSWTNLFTAVAEAPINTFQSLFNFEILGLNMRAAFGAMMSICVLLIIIKKVIL